MKEKRFFADYIPKQGGFRRVVKDMNGIPVDHEYEVELVLCSRDIEIGDEFYHAGTKAEDLWDEEFEEDAEQYPDFKNLNFKVVGRISKNATFVKKGHQFVIREDGYAELVLLHKHDKTDDDVELPIYLIKNNEGKFV